MITEQPQTQCGPCGRDWSARELQLCRRLDWRFLFSEVTLECVAYCGPAGDLLEALNLFASRVTPFLPDSPAIGVTRGETFDVAVLVHPTAVQVAAAHNALRSGGRLYLECRGPIARLGAERRWLTVEGLCEHLRDLGFEEVEAYLPWPKSQHARGFLPLTDAAGAGGYFLRGRAGFAGRLKSAIGTQLLRLGLLPYLAPDVSIVARKA